MANMQLADAMLEAYINDQLLNIAVYQKDLSWFESPERKMLITACRHYDGTPPQQLLLSYNIANHEIKVIPQANKAEGWKLQ